MGQERRSWMAAAATEQQGVSFQQQCQFFTACIQQAISSAATQQLPSSIQKCKEATGQLSE